MSTQSPNYCDQRAEHLVYGNGNGFTVTSTKQRTGSLDLQDKGDGFGAGHGRESPPLYAYNYRSWQTPWARGFFYLLGLLGFLGWLVGWGDQETGATDGGGFLEVAVGAGEF